MKKLIILMLSTLFFAICHAGTVTVIVPGGACSSAQSGDSITINCQQTATPPVAPPVNPPIVPPVTPPDTPPVASSCGALTVLNQPVDWAADNSRSFYYRGFGRGQTMIFKFTTGASQPGVANFGYSEYAGSTPERTVVISTSPCDFDINAAVSGNRPAATGKSGSAYFTIGISQRGYQRLEPNTTYYANFRNASAGSDADTCLPGENCGFVFTLNH